jgi:hypothetical protein
MTPDVVYEALYASLALADSILQIWLTVTFAVTVAAHLAGPSLTRPLFLLVLLLVGGTVATLWFLRAVRRKAHSSGA